MTHFSIPVLMMTSLIFSCGQAQQTPYPGSIASRLGGVWEGVYSLRDTTGALTGTENAKFTFERTGNFKTDFMAAEQRTVSGTYKEFQGQSVLLNISESTEPRLPSGGMVDYRYHIVDDQLHLMGANGEYKLVKATEQPASPPTGTGAAPSTPDKLLGWWACTDRQGNEWKLNMADAGKFWAQVSNPNSQPLLLQGGYRAREDVPNDFVLEISSGSNAQVVGSKLRLTLHDAASLTIAILGMEAADDAQALDSFNCTKR